MVKFKMAKVTTNFKSKSDKHFRRLTDFGVKHEFTVDYFNLGFTSLPGERGEGFALRFKTIRLADQPDRTSL